MSNTVNWCNPYADDEGVWLKGNLHTHTIPETQSGALPDDTMLQHYVRRGYDFIGLSDHMTPTDLSDERILTVPGVEWNNPDGAEHTGVYSHDRQDIVSAIAAQSQQELLDGMSRNNALVILNHPNWQLVPHYRREKLMERERYDGIEIYNGVIEVLQGYAISTDKWDYLLANGRKLLGFASDDAHDESHVGLGWNVVRARERTVKGVLDGLKSGNFYCSSGVTIDRIARSGDIITVETQDADVIDARGTGGARLSRVFAKSISFDISERDTSYVRFTAYGSHGSMAWTQPFFKSAGA